MSPTQAAMLTVSQGIFAMSLSPPNNCVTLKQSVSPCAKERSLGKQVTEKKITNEPPGLTKAESTRIGDLLGKRRHSTTPAPVHRETASRPRPRNAKSLTEIQVDTEIIDGLFTTTLCSTEL